MSDRTKTSLPAPFVWVRMSDPDPTRLDSELRLGQTGELVAVVTYMCDRWHTSVNLHRGSHQVRGAHCGSFEQGKRWVERWLESRASFLLIEIGKNRIRLAELETSRRGGARMLG